MDEYVPPSSQPRDDFRESSHAASSLPAPAVVATESEYGPDGAPRMTRLVYVFCILLTLLVLPPFVQKVWYAASFGREQARVDVALAGLDKLAPELEGLATAFRFVAQKVGASVVHIRTRGNAWSGADLFLGGPGPESGAGSGVIVDEEGYILTNNHVVAGSDEIWVQLVDGREVSARVVGTDVLTDLAVLKIDEPNLIALPWGDSDALEAGDMIWAVGSPFGLQRSVTFGIVSAKGRRLNGAATFQEFLQTDAAVNPGNSGGPLVDIRGNMVGINTAIMGPMYQGISFAIPSSIAEDIYNQLKTKRKVARGQLGVRLNELTPELAERLGIDSPRGVLITAVMRDSPADRARIEAGDVIIAWNDREVDDPTSLSRIVAATEVDSRAEVKLIRDGVEMTIEVVVGERP